MTPLDELLAREACRTLVLDAVAAVDARDADAFAALFAEDGVLVRPGGEPLRGRPAIHEAYAKRPATRITRHLVSNQRVTLDEGGRTARVISAVVLWGGDETDSPGPQGRPAKGPLVAGEFDDSLRWTEVDGWRFAERRASFVLHT